jgi:endonuclease III
MLRDNIGITHLKKFEEVPIPVDTHIAKATLTLGIVRGNYQGNLSNLFPDIRKSWFESVKGLLVDGCSMIALDLDEPLWHLSKYGCTFRDKESGECPLHNRCVMRNFCIPGKIDISGGYVELDT